MCRNMLLVWPTGKHHTRCGGDWWRRHLAKREWNGGCAETGPNSTNIAFSSSLPSQTASTEIFPQVRNVGIDELEPNRTPCRLREQSRPSPVGADADIRCSVERRCVSEHQPATQGLSRTPAPRGCRVGGSTGSQKRVLAAPASSYPKVARAWSSSAAPPTAAAAVATLAGLPSPQRPAPPVPCCAAYLTPEQPTTAPT